MNPDSAVDSLEKGNLKPLRPEVEGWTIQSSMFGSTWGGGR
jgi:hypothetical protein